METEQLLITGFKKLINIKDYSEITPSEICQEAGLETGSLPSNLEDKKDILNLVLKNEFDKRISVINNLKNKDVSLQNILISFLDFHFQYIENNPEITKLIIRETMLPEKSNLEAVNYFLNNFPKVLADTIEKEIEKKEIRNVNSELIANAFLHALHGVTLQVKYNNYNPAQAKKELVNLFCIGIKN